MGYMDNSGLWIPTGLEQTVPAAGGEYRTYGEMREIEVTLNVATAGAIGSPVVIDNNIAFPVGMIIAEVDIFCTVAGATGSTLDIGLVARDRVTEYDFNGIVAAFPLASMAVGTQTTIVKGSSFVGALITAGVPVTTQSYLCMNFNTTAFTAGVIRVRIKYFRP